MRYEDLFASVFFFLYCEHLYFLVVYIQGLFVVLLLEWWSLRRVTRLPQTIPETSQLVIMTGWDDKWLAEMFSDWACVLSGHTDMNVMWGCNSLVD